MPKIQEGGNDSDSDDESANLELMTKGINAFVKLNVLPQAPESTGVDPRLQNIVPQKMKTKRCMDDLSTNGDSNEQGGSDDSDLEKKKKASKKSKKTKK